LQTTPSNIDIAQFKEIYNGHYERLCQVAYKILKDEEEAREVVQVVMLQLWEEREKVGSIKSIGAYLYTLTYNRSLNIYKKVKKLYVQPLDNQPEVIQLDTEPLELQELQAIIATAIDLLPAKCKEIFLLSREESLTYRQISDQLGISVKTVEAQMGIALKKLREALQKENQIKISLFSILL